MPILTIQSLKTTLHSGIPIVDGISFDIRAGETFALLGESGCGKSMTALSLMRLLPDGVMHAGGAAQMDGVALFDIAEREMRAVRGGKMAMIFQEPGLSLNPVMTVGEQIAEVLELHGVFPLPSVCCWGFSPVQPRPTPCGCNPSPDGRRATRPSPIGGGGIEGGGGRRITQRCIELLDQVGIPDAARRLEEYPFQLSGGMKQRVMIAMALAGSPKLLIADEPTTALDVTIQAQVLQLLRDTQSGTGMAMLLITHDLGVVAENAHRVGVMYAGQIVEQASRQQLFASPLHPYTQKLFAALPGNVASGQTLSAIPGSVPPLGSIRMGCRFAPRCDRAWDLCHEQNPPWNRVGEGQGVRCHLYREGATGDEQGNIRVADDAKCVPGLSPAHLPTSSPLLQVENLQVHFPIRKGILQRVVGQVKAVDGVSLRITQGRTLALVGESGCGKTTLGKALLQLIRPTAGSVMFGGNELVGSHASRAGMQMVFQDPYASLNPKMRVAEILEEGMVALACSPNRACVVGASVPYNHGLPLAGATPPPVGEGLSRFPISTSESRQEHIDVLLDKVGLARDSKWRYPHEFSGGQRQRIAIARALAVSPQLLICDEPTSALDVSVQAQILNLLKALQQEMGLSYLFITHNLAVVEYLAHEVCVMYLGRVVERGTTREVLQSPKHPYTQALLSAVPRIDGKGRSLIKLEGDLPSPANPPQGCHFAPRCAQVIPSCARYPSAAHLSDTHSVCCHIYPD